MKPSQSIRSFIRSDSCPPSKVVERALKLLKGRKLIMMRQLFLSDGFAGISKASRFFFKGAFGGLR